MTCRPVVVDEVSRGDNLSAARNREHARLLVEAAFERGQPLVAHEHEEARFRHMAGRCGVEPAGTVLDGPSPVEGQRGAGCQGDPAQRLGR